MNDAAGRELQALRERYEYDVNAALQAGRPDLAGELAQRYPDDALRVLTRHLGRPEIARRRPAGRRRRSTNGPGAALAWTRAAWSGTPRTR